MPSKAFKLAEAMVSNPVMSDMVENPTATPTQITQQSNKITAVEAKTSAISDTGVISVNTKNIVSNNVLTQSFDSNQVVGFNLTDSINAVSPIVSVFKEIPQQGFSSKGQWDVNSNATNYNFYDEKPYSTYASSTLTPSATGDGTFTLSSGSFSSSDVGKKVVGNSGSAIITSAAGSYTSVTAFADTSAISSWQLFGAQGKADGSGIELTGYKTSFDWLGHDKTTPSSSRSGSFPGWGQSNTVGDYQRHCLSPNGDYYYMFTQGSQLTNIIYKWELTTPYDLSTMSYVGNYAWSYYNNTKQMMFSPDGNQFITNNTTYHYIRWQTAVDGNYSGADTQGSASSTTGSRTFHYGALISDKSANANWWFWINEAGTKLFVGESWYDKMYSWDISTAWDLSTVDTSSQVNYAANSQIGDMMFAFRNDGTEFITHNKLYQNFPTPYNSTSALTVTPTTTNIYNGTLNYISLDQKTYLTGDDNSNVSIYSDLGATALPYSQYSPALTNSSTGQINSSSWQDINSMTADETKNDGDVFYAVSTDDHTSWGVAKGTDGVRKIAKNNSGTWQYNNNAGTTNGYDLSVIAPANKYIDLGVQYNYDYHGAHMSADGYHYYAVNQQDDNVRQWTLSTQWDLSSAAYQRLKSSNLTQPRALAFSASGDKMYVSQNTGDVRQFTLTSNWNIATASGGSSAAAQLTNVDNFVWKPDGTRIWTYYDRIIKEFSVSSAWDLTSTVTLVRTQTSSSTTYLPANSGKSMTWNADGSAFFEGGGNNKLQRVPCTTAWDISTMQAPDLGLAMNSLSYTNTAWASNRIGDMHFGDNGTKLYLYEDNKKWARQFSTGSLVYGTSETWVNATTNNELSALQQALGAQSINRMDKAQLDAVADGYHFSQDSADTLDLMIAPYAASGSGPISDGVTINYDAAALVREAIPGTDYIAEFPNNTTINIKSLVNTNMKVRAL
jgi:hypothetical protein